MLQLLLYLTESEPSPFHPLSGIREEFTFHVAFNIAFSVAILAGFYLLTSDLHLQPDHDSALILHVQHSRFLPSDRKMQEIFLVHTCPV